MSFPSLYLNACVEIRFIDLCNATIRVVPLLNRLRVNILSDKPISTTNALRRVAPLGTSESLRCETVSYPAVTSWTWTFVPTNIPRIPRQVNATSIYTINNITDGVYGTYTCVATNAMGDSADIVFTVSSAEATNTGSAHWNRHVFSLK